MEEFRRACGVVIEKSLEIPFFTEEEKREMQENDRRKKNDFFRSINALGIKIGEERLIKKDNLLFKIQRLDDDSDGYQTYDFFLTENSKKETVHLALIQGKEGVGTAIGPGDGYQGWDNLVTITEGFIKQEIQPRKV